MFSLAAAVYTWWQLQPSRMARLGRNAAVGMRSYAIMRSESTWRAGHQAAWPKAKQAAVVLFIGSLASAVVLPYTAEDTGAFVWSVIVFVSYIGYMWLLLLGFKHANSAARKAHDAASEKDT